MTPKRQSVPLKGNKKAVAGFEIVLMIVSLFAFMYFAGFSGDSFSLVSAGEEKRDRFQDFLDMFRGGELIENESWETYPISSTAAGVGCCFVSREGQVCGTSSPENCVSDSPFAEGALCAATSFCEKGCCYDELKGVYDKNVLELACPSDWVEDPNCNMPGARLGCCVLGSESIFETRGQCEVDSLVRAIGGNEVVDWRGDVSEGGCLLLSATQKEGACVLSPRDDPAGPDEGGCKFVTEADCFSYDGDFSEDYLCTSPSLNTSCKMTGQTRCADGKDEVYFVDSCGNAANVYDSERIEDVDYWDRVVDSVDLCGAGEGNAGSESCGNCNRFLGGICASAGEDAFDVDVGEFYCRDTSCMFDGVDYENGESWCVYDGVIGEGNDLPGSRHWKYVCSQGVVQVEPCADYRNQICVQTKEFEVDGEMVEFENAVCVANNWRACINLNGKRGEKERSDGEKEACVNRDSVVCANSTLYRGNTRKMNCIDDVTKSCMEGFKSVVSECSETLNCRVEHVDIADKFNFDICLPRYPGGFDLNSERYQATAEGLCGMATQTCTVVKKPKKSGGCKIIANEDCLDSVFGEEMNDFCRGLGDCGGSVNIVGEWSGNYKIKKSPGLSGSWVDKLADLAVPISGQFAETEDYSEYLEAAGVWGVPGAPSAEEEEESGFDLGMIGQGISGLGSAMSFAATGKIMGFKVLDAGFLSNSAASSMAGFANVAMGAGIGMSVGVMFAKMLGLSETGSMLMGIGGAMIGAAIMMQGFNMALLTSPLFMIGVALVVLALFFGMGKCPPVKVEFECRPWQAPVGGADCEKCNGDPLKPCSEYRCESLGAGCELINIGTDDELCVSGNPNDVDPPVIRRQIGVGFSLGNDSLGEAVNGSGESNKVSYEDKDNGFGVVNARGGCLDAYTPLAFGIVTNEPTQCRFDVERREFEEMDFKLGGNSYLYNHTTVFSLPDPSHGQSQGGNWTGDLTLYIKCRDRYGLVSPDFYEVDMCVREGEDRTAPRIVASEPKSGGIVGFDAVSEDILIVTNELASCRWDLSDVDYWDMGNSLECADSLGSPSNVLGYVCEGSLPIGNSSRDYYVRCVDQPWLTESEVEGLGSIEGRNANVESFIFSSRKASSRLSIDKVRPDSDFEVSSDFVTIDLKVATSGGGDSHFCSYSFSGYDRMIQMFETGDARTHSQTLNRVPGRQNIYLECRDEAGDFARSFVKFNIVRDSSAPAVARVWQVGGFVNLVLAEEGECRFSFDSCKFAWSEGNLIGGGKELRFAVVRGEKYFIRCEDEFGTAPNGCSVEVMAV